ncbi:hypothetical protein NDU88_001273 [Pleurodeles waltl]|uniref:Uncharacterized protein n=1 Tax=Pleurodeles waltl TaxID=8319 RepID=A0AAV7R6P5_PLEWA|nr:hypothetical protein NDU88_001273 [Pleurodeles waltl]
MKREAGAEFREAGAMLAQRCLEEKHFLKVGRGLNTWTTPTWAVFAATTQDLGRSRSATSVAEQWYECWGAEVVGLIIYYKLQQCTKELAL